MAEINNSVALGVKVPDIGNTLLQALQIKNLQATTAQTQQNVDYNAFQQQQNGGYRATDVNTLAEANKKRTELGGQIGNILVNDQSKDARKQAIEAAKSAGIPIDPRVEQHIMTAPAATVKQYGANMQRAGQSSTSNIEQSPGAIAQRSQSQSGGSELGTMYGPAESGPAPTQGQPPAATAAPPGTLQSPATPAPAAGLSLQERKLEAAGNAGKRVEEFDTYRKENEGASIQKVALRQLMQDADRVRTGAGADKEQAARKWLMAAGQLIPGLGDVEKKFADPVAAFESISKNAGLISRTAIKQVGGTAASELDAISKSLVGTETSGVGIKINASQLVGLESYKQARFQAAQQYQDANGTLKGFAADFNKKAGPAAWVYMSLPAEERAKIAESLRKTKDGQHTLNSIAQQLDYIHKSRLDEGID